MLKSRWPGISPSYKEGFASCLNGKMSSELMTEGNLQAILDATIITQAKARAEPFQPKKSLPKSGCFEASCFSSAIAANSAVKVVPMLAPNVVGSILFT